MNKIIKKNQIIISVIALMLVAAGYLNYSSIHSEDAEVATSSQTNYILEMAGIGDAQLVSSNAVEEEEYTNTEQEVLGKEQNTNTEQEILENKQNSNTEQEVLKNEQNTNIVAETMSGLENAKITDSSQYFTSSKLSRDTMYSQMIETYEKILANESIPAEQKSIAQTEITNINNIKNSIMIAENLIQTKGFENVVIFVNDTSISVIVKSDELSKEEIAQVQNIVTRELKADINNVHISNKE